ncbi:MAG: hypothetical protein JWM78_975 [Verrucomicrobiaceae bacterium]|nr:hypothetical protein [Verrucomicrobiaceae bacterium]
MQIENNRIVSIHGDKDQAIGEGYMCFKGLQAEAAHHGPQRLLRSLKRGADGDLAPVPLTDALDKIAVKIGAIIDRHGPRSVAVLEGGGCYLTSTAHAMYRSFLAAVGSDQIFTVNTIDQSGRMVAVERMGVWPAGCQHLDTSDVILIVGTNPLVAHTTPEFLTTNPTRRIKQAKARGTKIICIDPRRCETARYADLHLQPLPGADGLILGGLIRIVLAEGWHDIEFCQRHVGTERLDDLVSAVQPFTEAFVAERAGLAPGQLRAAAAMFARDGKRGSVFTGTGTGMGPFSNLALHFAQALNVICGRFTRAGEMAVISPQQSAYPLYADVYPATRSWDGKPPSRTRGVRHLLGERLTATLADEILEPGPEKIRVLIVDGANAAQCVPDQLRMVAALKDLDLLVVIDPTLTITGQLADYVIAPTMYFERPDLPIEYSQLFHKTFLQYTSAVLDPPAGSELIDGALFYWHLAARLDLQLDFKGVALDMSTPPSVDDLIAIMMRNASVSLEELKQYPSGREFNLAHAVVLPPPADQTNRFDVMPADVQVECQKLLEHEKVSRLGAGFTHLLSSRRMRDFHNSTGTQIGAVLKRSPYNPAFLHPDDLTDLGLQDGDHIRITSEHGSVEAIAAPDPDLRRGVMNLSHGWGGLPSESEGRGSSVNLLTNAVARYESVNAMPWISAMPVRVEPCGAKLAAV